MLKELSPEIVDLVTQLLDLRLYALDLGASSVANNIEAIVEGMNTLYYRQIPSFMEIYSSSSLQQYIDFFKIVLRNCFTWRSYINPEVICVSWR